ncbi:MULTISPECIES: DUF3040 domain-containing protein [unclassified Arthrobacter]|uniref:DUF3040 domain-containing protein n=1 Tax=unclassified Arthrobacter TaxID=235627 RepID=UPI00339A163C
MPLSDRERKQLEELEADLAAVDPQLAQRLSSGSIRSRLRARTFLGLALCLLGLVLLITGVSTQIIVVGVGGFLLMGAGTYLLLGSHPRRLRKSLKQP